MISVAVTINPADESDADDRRADMEVYLPDRTIVGDFTVDNGDAWKGDGRGDYRASGGDDNGGGARKERGSQWL